MGLFGGAGKEAAKTVQETVEQAIPALQDAAQSAMERATFSMAGIVADVANRLDGAECPMDLTLTVSATLKLSGKIGQLKLSVPEVGYEVS